MFRKNTKTKVQALIEEIGLEEATDKFSQIVLENVKDKHLIRQLMLEEMEGASLGNETAKSFVHQSGLSPEEYKGALEHSHPEIDGRNGAKTFLDDITWQLRPDRELMVRFRLMIDDILLRKAQLEKYSETFTGDQESFKFEARAPQQDEGMYLLPSDEEFPLVDLETFHTNLRSRSETKRLEDLADCIESDFGPCPHGRKALLNWLREYGERLMLPGAPKGAGAGDAINRDYQAWIGQKMIDRHVLSQIHTLTPIENENHPAFGTLIEQVIHLINSRLVFSDVYIRQDSPMMLRLPAGLVAVSDALITKEKIEEFFQAIEPNWLEHIQDNAFDRSIDLNTASIRANCFTFQGKKRLGCVIRALPKDPLELSQLGLRQCEQDFINLKSGLVLIIGGAGHGKSTTIASMLDQINKTRSGNIITLEEPVETLIPKRKCMISEREVGFDGDVESYYVGAMDAICIDSDVIVIGDIRDAQSAQAALSLAESGSLVFASLNALSTEFGLQKLLRLLGHDESKTQMLANVLQGVLCQALLPSLQGDRFYLATECLTSNPEVVRMVGSGNMAGIRGLMESTDGQSNQGCHSMNTALFQLVRDQKISMENARNASPDRKNFDRKDAFLENSKSHHHNAVCGK
ncbi:MAG: ATPase, T2SS/T4P/T4SS family [Undibacterium sp.]|nr:ATPase, T2SS/T4P/T4SS family [Undibacterium sp.]